MLSLHTVSPYGSVASTYWKKTLSPSLTYKSPLFSPPPIASLAVSGRPVPVSRNGIENPVRPVAISVSVHVSVSPPSFE
ncbi:MAG: hypothetical protein A3I06_12850 [Candidatus Lindowbacteria bacterium RIFCSPLOWO2_02_FULL_62_12]|nr:MAG: hypothetical protein A3I06_12850 [Candidatus Lindowbacteria bacterium RIFCSPLOWO2_02_FULL_62_12]